MRAAASSHAAEGHHAAAERPPIRELQQPRWRAEGARREASACEEAALPSASPPWADMSASLIQHPDLTRCWPAAVGCNTLPSSSAVQWRCACSDHARKLFGGSSLSRGRREARRAAAARLEAAAKQVTAAQSRCAEPKLATVSHDVGAHDSVGTAAADAEAARAATDIRTAVATFRGTRTPRRGEAAQTDLGVASERGPPPRSTARRVAAVLASSTPSAMRPTSARCEAASDA